MPAEIGKLSRFAYKVIFCDARQALEQATLRYENIHTGQPRSLTDAAEDGSRFQHPPKTFHVFFLGDIDIVEDGGKALDKYIPYQGNLLGIFDVMDEGC